MSLRDCFAGGWGRRGRSWFVGLVVFGVFGWALGATIRVPGDQPTIQAGVDVAAEGDTVLVAPGTYSGPGNKNIDFHGIDRTLVSEDGAEATVISPTGLGRGIRFENGETRASLVRGFTITNGRTWVLDGGGIRCENSSPTIMNCIISENRGEYGGGGICCQEASPIIAKCIISANDGGLGAGGILCWDGCSPIITNCTITGNKAAGIGGGLRCGNGSDATIEYCIVAGNTAGTGGGFYCDNSSPILTNCTISGNSAPRPWGGDGGGLWCENSFPTLTNCTVSGNSADRAGGGLWCASSSSPTLTNCILWGDTPDEIYSGSSFPGDSTLTYCNVQGGWIGEGNIDADPRFVTYEGFQGALRKLSPCIDAGYPGMEDGLDWTDPFFPPFYYEANTRACDMGAYGGPEAWRWLWDEPPAIRHTALDDFLLHLQGSGQ